VPGRTSSAIVIGHDEQVNKSDLFRSENQGSERFKAGKSRVVCRKMKTPNIDIDLEIITHQRAQRFGRDNWRQLNGDIRAYGEGITV
jgi:hypothetical protein